MSVLHRHLLELLLLLEGKDITLGCSRTHATGGMGALRRNLQVIFLSELPLLSIIGDSTIPRDVLIILILR